MASTNNQEPRRFWTTERQDTCSSCGAAMRGHRHGSAFCDECLEWSRQDPLDDVGDELGGGD